jgi:fatty-acyl-CoA synthase
MIVSGPAPSKYHAEPTIGLQLEHAARTFSDGEALIWRDRRLTWADYRNEARRVARALVAAGVERGDHIAIWLPNHPEWPLTWMAASYIGALVVPLNTRYGTDEVRYILRQSDAKLIVCEGQFLGIDFVAMLSELCPGLGTQRLGGDELPELRSAVVIGAAPPGALSWEQFLAGGDAIAEETIDELLAGVRADDPTIMVFTSGTTGRPKGVVHSHRVLRNECSISEFLRIESDSRILGHMPFFHVAGGLSAVLPSVITGACLILMERWDPANALRTIEAERISVFGGIATHFIDVLAVPELGERDVSSLQSGWIGGSPNPRPVIAGAITELGMQGLLPVYGMTETTSVTTYPRPTDPFEVLCSGRGIPISDFELKVVDPDRAELEAEQEGEIAVRGHVVMQGYYRDPEATNKVIDSEGWFYTGDLGVLDSNGYLRITGRRTDMYIVGGANVYPAEIEMAITEHPAVSQAHVVGVPDARLGEVGFAFIEVTAGATMDEDAIREFCRGRLAQYKSPQHVRFVTEWPLTDTGKVRRSALSELASAALSEGARTTGLE